MLRALKITGIILAILVVLAILAAVISLIWQAYDDLYDITIHGSPSSWEPRTERLYRSTESLPRLNGDYDDFKGYFTEPNGQGVQITDEDGNILVRPEKNAHIYALCVPHQYHVQVLDDGGNEISSHTVVIGDDISSFIDGIPMRDDYDLKYTVDWGYGEPSKKTIGANGTMYSEFVNFHPNDYKFWHPPYKNERSFVIQVEYVPSTYTVAVVYPDDTIDRVPFNFSMELYTIAPKEISGKTFIGYSEYEDADLDEILPEDTVFASASTRVYAIYRDNVTLLLGGVSHTFYEGQKLTLPAPETIPVGYEHAGWEFDNKSLGADVYTELTVTALHQGAVMTPAWRYATYKLTYVSDGVTVREETYGYGVAKAITHTEAKLFYDFDGWYLNDAFTGGEVTEIVPTAYGDITLYARFVPKSFTVALDPVGGAISSYEISISYGSAFTVPLPTITGRSFIGWYYLGPTGEKIFVTGSDGVSTFPCDVEHFTGKSTEQAFEDLNLIAEYSVNKYTVTFTVGGEVYLTERIEHGERASVPTPPAVKGYDFVRWLGADGEEYDFDTRITGDITVTAELSVKTYTITLRVKSGEGYIVKDNEKYTEIQITYTYGQTSVDLTNITLHRDGYDFSGWYMNGILCISEGGVVLLNNLQQNLNDSTDTVLYANWV